MYRIELAPGEETVFRTIEELAVGVRNGLVTPRARIYHAASQKWLPIEFHPHYKKAVELSSHRQDLQPAKIPASLESLNFAVPRASAPSAPTSVPPPAETQVASVVTPTVPEPAAPLPPSPPPPPPPPAREPMAPAMAAPSALPAFEPEPVRVVVEMPEPEEQHPVHLPLLLAAPTAVEDEPIIEDRAPHSATLPPVVASPVGQFPAIVYPEITPAEPPVAEPVLPGARSRRARHILGALVVLALGGYGMMSLAPARGDASSTTGGSAAVDPPALPEPAAPAPVEQRAPDPAPSRTVVMSQPASSGFAPALEPRAIVSTNAASIAASPPASPAPKDSSLAPAPVDIQLDVPALAGAESLVPAPRQRGDSAMKRILRAVNGGKDLPARP